MFRAIAHGLRNLLSFSGRDSRDAFDRYFVFVLIAWFVLSAIVLTPVAAPMDAQIRAYARTHPGRVAETYDYSLALTGPHPDLHLDNARSSPRRLHDADRSARWGLLPLPALVGSFALSAYDFSTPDAGLRPGLLVIFLGAVGFGLLYWMLRREGRPGPNRFGPPPAL